MAVVSNYYVDVAYDFGLVGSLCLLIIFMALWERDFWLAQGSQLREWLRRKRVVGLDFYLAAISKEKEMIEVIPELPKSDKLPSYDDMAKLLVKALPASDRLEAYRLLVWQLLPKELPASRNLARWEFDAVYEDIILLFQKKRSYERMSSLKRHLFYHEIRDLMITSYSLAIARYVKEYPEAANRLDKVDREWVSQWEGMSISELEDKAVQLFSEVERWEKVAEAEYPELWDEYKLRSFNVQLKLQAVYSGSFHVAMGDFAIFLHIVGATFEELRIH